LTPDEANRGKLKSKGGETNVFGGWTRGGIWEKNAKKKPKNK